MKVLVVTIVHRPDDARIRQRQIPALLNAGHSVTYAAPFTGWSTPLPKANPAGLTCVDIPRAAGRSRLGAVRAARRLVRQLAPTHDVVLFHDPELLAAIVGIASSAGKPAIVWDVHEDTAAAVSLKPWLPKPVRGVTASGFGTIEHWAERHVHLLLAEHAYAERFQRQHPVVPNSTPVPADVATPDVARAVYVGHMTIARGAGDLVTAAERLRDSGIAIHAVGHADAAARDLLEPAHARGDLTWHGFLPNAEALALVEGSYAGLSLLHDEPNYRHSRPTKVIEYFARGVPVVTTPTPLAVELVEQSGAGLVVPFGDAESLAGAILRLAADPPLRQRFADAGRQVALRDHDWNRDGEAFVATLEGWAS